MSTLTARARGFAKPIDALGMCLIDSSAYAERKSCGLVRVRGLTYPGREHWAALHITDDGLGDALATATVRDGTMRQFSATAPVVFTGSLDDWLDDMTELLCDHLYVELYVSHDDRTDPFHAETFIREDIEPTTLVHPWERP